MTAVTFKQIGNKEYEFYKNGSYGGRIVEFESWSDIPVPVCWVTARGGHNYLANDCHQRKTNSQRQMARKKGIKIARTKLRLLRVKDRPSVTAFQLKLDSSLLRVKENNLVTRNAVATLPEAMRLAAMLYA